MHLQKHLGIRRCHRQGQRMVVQSNQSRRLEVHHHRYPTAYSDRLDMDPVQRNKHLRQR